MKSIIITSIMISLLSFQQLNASAYSPSQSPIDSLTLERAVKGYEISLQHELDSVVESSIYNTMVLAIEVPNAKLGVIEYRLKELSKTHASSSVRIKAFLALEFINDQEFRRNYTNALISQPMELNRAQIFRNVSEQFITKANLSK